MVKTKLLFLDIDGVLNTRSSFNEVAQSNTILLGPVEQLNRIIHATDAWIVLSSAWRYQISNGATTPVGFKYLLRTHGVTNNARIFGMTAPDEICAHCGAVKTYDMSCEACHQHTNRACQIQRFITTRPPGETSYVVIDNDDFGFTAAKMPFVKTDDAVGLTEANADKAIAILKGVNKW